MGMGMGSQQQAASSVTYNAVSQAYFDAIVAAGGDALTSERKGIVDTLVVTLVDAGILAKLDALFVANSGTVSSRVNIVNPTVIATAVNNPTFTANKGFAGAASGTKYLDLGVNLSTASKYKYQDSTLGVWLLAQVSDTVALFGSRKASSGGDQCGNTIAVISGTSSRYSAWSNNVALPIATTLTCAGFIAGSLNGNANELCKDGVQVATSDQAANIADNQVLNGNAFALCPNTNGSASTATYTGIVCALVIGGKLTNSSNPDTGSEHKTLYTALNTYLTAIGAFA